MNTQEIDLLTEYLIHLLSHAAKGLIVTRVAVVSLLHWVTLILQCMKLFLTNNSLFVVVF